VVGWPGLKQNCLNRIDELWTGMSAKPAARDGGGRAFVATDARHVTLAASEEVPPATLLARWLDRIAALPAEQRTELARAFRSACGGGGASSRLIGYVVTRHSASVSPAQLRTFLAQRLPPALVPASFHVLPALPRLPSGKLDRGGLPPPGAGRAHLSQPYVPPRNPVERSICEFLGEVLGVPDVGIHDEFWELGGESLAAARLMYRIRQEFGVDLGVQLLLEGPTAARLATCVADARAAAAAREQAPLVATPRGEPPPLSSAQLRHWFLQMVDPASPAYNICDTLRFTGPIDVAALERAATTVIGRHEILRTCYSMVDGEPRQDIAPPGPFSLPVADLRDMPAQAGGRIADELIAKDRGQPFNLGRLPLLRLRLIRLTDSDSLFSVVAHHIAADDWAFNVFYDELSALYGAALDGRPCPFPPLAVQYADYAVWERRMLAYRLAAGLDFWRERLRTAPASALLPVPGGAAGTSAVGWHRFVVSEELTGRLVTWCQARSVTMFAACLAAYAAVLGRHTGQDEIVVGVPFASRERLELERMIGCFINPVALRIDLSGAPSLADMVARVDRIVRACYAMQYVPFEKVTDAVRLDRIRDGLPGAAAPLFDVVLNFVPQPSLPRLRDVRAALVDDLPPSEAARSGLTLYLEKTGRTVLGRMAYATSRLSTESVAALAGDFLTAMGGFADD
jgi:acyl carrier protein